MQEWTSAFSEALLRLSRFPTLENWTYLFCSTKLLLAAPAHGGKQRLHTTERLLRKRFSKWHSGELASLFEDVRISWAKKSNKRNSLLLPADLLAQSLPPQTTRRVCQLTASGCFSKACKLLCSRGIAADTPHTRANLESLFPQQEQNVTPCTGDTGSYDPSEIKAILERTPSNLAPGPSGLRFDHLKAALLLPDQSTVNHFLFSLTTFVNTAVSGSFPKELQPFLCGGIVIPCNKKDGGVRPIVLGETLRNIVSNCVLLQSAPPVKSQLDQHQYGVRHSGYGIQGAIFKAQHFAHNLETNIILKIDFRNAFNSINRRVCMLALESLEPDCCPWVSWCLQSSSYVSFKSEIIPCANGVQQGEPMSPLLFCVAIDPAIQALSKVDGLSQLWYLDDGLFYGPPSVVATALTRLKELLPALHLSINLAKCEIYSANGIGVDFPPELRDIPIFRDQRSWSFLGAPLTPHSQTCINTALERFLLVNKRIGELALEHPAEALALTRSCAGACKVMHVLQAGLPAGQQASFLAKCSTSLKNTVDLIVGSTLTLRAWDLVRLPVKLGGLGVHDPFHCVYSARLACLTRLIDLASDLHLEVTEVISLQHQALEVFRHDISDSSFQLPADHVELQSRLTLYGYKQLAARALRQADSWEQQRLISLSASHATAWTTGPNPWVSMSSTEYRYGLKWILGVELLEQPTVCTACSMLQDCYGRHAVTCRRSGAITRCHNLLRDVAKSISVAAGYTVFSEQTIPSNHALRPADILIHNWKEGKPLALDFTVSTPSLNADSDPELKIAASMLDQACQKKVRHYRQACERDGWLFQPFAVDVFGAIHPTARKIAEAIIHRFEEKHTECKTYPFATFVWRALTSASVMRAATQTMASATNPSGTATLLQLLESPNCKRRLLAQLPELQGTGSSAPADLHMGSINNMPSAGQSVPHLPTPHSTGTSNMPIDVSTPADTVSTTLSYTYPPCSIPPTTSCMAIDTTSTSADAVQQQQATALARPQQQQQSQALALAKVQQQQQHSQAVNLDHLQQQQQQSRALSLAQAHHRQSQASAQAKVQQQQQQQSQVLSLTQVQQQQSQASAIPSAPLLLQQQSQGLAQAQ